jgi:hypothetical protein
MMNNRTLHDIAKEIQSDWNNVYFGAKPYLMAMLEGKNVTQANISKEKFYLDSYRSVVAYFLSNATTWRGDVARRIKLELNSMIKHSK